MKLKINPSYKSRMPAVVLFLTVLVVLYLLSRHNYLLFHSFAEMFSIVVAFAIFTITWSSRRFLEDAFFVIMGSAYLFISGLDLLHTLSYKGMGIFEKFDADLPTQLWIAARYLESFSFLAAISMMEKKADIYKTLGIFSAVFAMLLLSIFYWDIFPQCYIEGEGLTWFKKASEYVICAILLICAWLLFIGWGKFDAVVSEQLIASVVFTIFSELCFTFYIGVYDLSNLIGHYLKILSCYFVYKAIIETGINKPVDFLFKSLGESERNFKRTFDQSPLGAAMAALDYRMERVNSRLCAMTGYTAEVLFHMDFQDLIYPDDRRTFLEQMNSLLEGEKESSESDLRFIRKGGRIWWGRLFARLIKDESDGPICFLPIIDDITEKKEAEEKIRTSLREKELLLKEVHHRVKNNMQVVSSMLSIQSNHESDETCLKVLQDSRNRIHSMALIHENLYRSENLSKVDFSSYVRNLIHNLSESHGERAGKLKVVENMERVNLGIDLAIPCGLVLNELITNCLEHAFKGAETGEVRVSIRPADFGNIEIMVVDNGAGIPKNIDLNTVSSMGLRLVNGIVEHQLGGTISIKRKNGTEVLIVFNPGK